MNKKTYMIPALEVVKIGTQQMLAVSMYGQNATGPGMARELDFTVDGEY